MQRINLNVWRENQERLQWAGDTDKLPKAEHIGETVSALEEKWLKMYYEEKSHGFACKYDDGTERLHRRCKQYSAN